jgi:hypothetical protein
MKVAHPSITCSLDETETPVAGVWGHTPTIVFELDGMRLNADRRFCTGRLEASMDDCDIEEDMGQVSSDVKTLLTISHNTLTITEGNVL